MLRVFCALVVILLVGCDQQASVEIQQSVVHKLAGSTMGTTYHVSWSGPADENLQEWQQAIDERLAQVNAIMSTYDPESELSRLNSGRYEAEDNGWVGISPDLATVLSIGQELYQHTDGHYDVTIGPLVNAWGFGPGAKTTEPPSDEELELLRQRVGSDKFDVEISPSQIRFRQRLYIDLSSIAKGWGVDEVARLMRLRGAESYLVEIGGELVTRGLKPDGQPWRVAVERPDTDALERQAQLIIAPGDGAVATSGDYRNYFQKDGVRYSHTIDPDTGRPITHTLASVTVIAGQCVEADGWATALNVSGPEKARALAEDHNLAVYLIEHDGHGAFTEWASSEFKRRYPDALSGQ